MKILLITYAILSTLYFYVSYASASSSSLEKNKIIELKKISLIDDNLNLFIDEIYKRKFCSYTQLWQLNNGYKLSQTFGIFEENLIFFKLAIIKQRLTPNSKSPQLHKWFLKRFFDTEASNKEIWYDFDYTVKLSKGTLVLVDTKFMKFLQFILSHFPDLPVSEKIGTEAIFSNKAVENNYYGIKGPFKVDINFNNGSKHDILELIPCINKMIKSNEKKFDLKEKNIIIPDIDLLLKGSPQFQSRYKKVFKIRHYSFEEENKKFQRKKKLLKDIKKRG